VENQSLTRTRLLNVPVDAVSEQQALQEVERLLLDKQHHQILFLTLRGLFRGRRDPEFRRCLREAALVLPVYPGLVRATRFLRRGSLSLYSPFSFVIRLLSVAERLNRTVYLLGARKEDLEQAERNLRGSFPRLRLVGRFAGYFPRPVEKNVLVAIKKATPAFLLVADGLPGRELWILRRKRELTPGIALWVGDCFGIFSGKRRSSVLPGEGATGLLAPFTVLLFWLMVLAARVFRR
jgi:N-acetylglucosaminyldiphosphoundecaprenol N-acetyl-beta-D-mannosaminyltransferase